MKDWYIYVDDNDGDGPRPATPDEMRTFASMVKFSAPLWNVPPVKTDIGSDVPGGGAV